MFPKIFVKEMSGKFGLQCVLNFLQAYLATSIFNTNAVFLGDIYLPIFFLPLGETSSKRLLDTFFSWEISPEGFQREICQTDPP